MKHEAGHPLVRWTGSHEDLLDPVRNLKGKIGEPRYEMIARKGQHHRDMALLTFNLINYGKLADGARDSSKRVLSLVEAAGMMTELMTLEVRNRQQWRTWLGKHQGSSPGVWLVFYKDHTLMTRTRFARRCASDGSTA